MAGWLFVLPALVIFGTFIFWPILQIFWLSFHEWSVITPEKPWVGLDNYAEILRNDDFKIAAALQQKVENVATQNALANDQDLCLSFFPLHRLLSFARIADRNKRLTQ